MFYDRRLFITRSVTHSEPMFPDYLPALGFAPCNNQDELHAFCHRVFQRGTTIQVPNTERKLVRWSPGNDVHVWMFVTPANEVESLVPVYGRASDVPLDIEQVHPRMDSEGTPMTLTCWVLGSEREEASGRNRVEDASKTSHDSSESNHPVRKKGGFHILCPDAPLYRDEVSTTTQNPFKLFATARRPKLHPDSDVFEEREHPHAAGKQMSSRTLLPAGLLNLDPETAPGRDGPPPYAYVTGHVRDVKRRENPESDRTFYDLTVETRGTTLTVVVGMDPLPAPPEPGQVIEGLFLFIGMMKPH